MSDHLDTGDLAAGFAKPHDYTVWEDIQGSCSRRCLRRHRFTWSTPT